MKMKVAKYISEFMVKKGVEHVFTITGGGAMHLNDAFGHQKGLQCIYNHHEQACAIAAEGYARYTGRVAAVCVTADRAEPMRSQVFWEDGRTLFPCSLYPDR